MAKVQGFQEKYIVDKDGKRTAVILDVRDYGQILEELEELESIRAFDEAKASEDIAIPLRQALEQIEKRTKVTSRSDDQVWEMVGKSRDGVFSLLGGREHDRVVGFDDEKVIVENTKTGIPRVIPRRDVLLIYRELWNRKKLMLRDVRAVPREKQRGVGAALLALLLHVFSTELEKVQEGREVGLRVKE